MKHGGPVSSSTRRKLGSCNSLPTISKKLTHWMTNHSSWTHTRGEATANCCPQDWRHSPANLHKESWLLKAEIHQGSQGWSRNTWSVPAAGGSVWTTPRGPRHTGTPTILWRFPLRLSQQWRKILLPFREGGEEEPFLNTAEPSALGNKACPQEKPLNHCQPSGGFIRAWQIRGQRNTPFQPLLAVLSYLRGGE